MLKRLLFVFLMATLAGCTTTGDPTKGGIFWSEKKAVERQNNLKQTLDDEDRAVQSIQTERERLEAQRNISRLEQNRQRQRLSALDANLNGMSKKIKQYKANTAAKQSEKLRIENEIRTFEQRITALQKNTQLSVQEKKRKIEILSQEVDGLLEIILAL